MNKIETYELTHLMKQLKDIAKKDYTGSGIRLEIAHLDGTAIGEMEFIGELLPKLIPVLLDSLKVTLGMRLARANSDMLKIQAALAKE